MSINLISLTTRELRALFLKESKKFLKTLDFNSIGVKNQELKDCVLNEIRERLKEIMHLIDLKEKQEAGKTN